MAATARTACRGVISSFSPDIRVTGFPCLSTGLVRRVSRQEKGKIRRAWRTPAIVVRRAMTPEALAIRPAGTAPDQLAAYSGLLNAVFETRKFTPEAIAWRYRDNPAGQVVGADAWDGE